VTAQIFAFSDYRNPPTNNDEIDLVTAVDVAIRDLARFSMIGALQRRGNAHKNVN